MISIFSILEAIRVKLFMRHASTGLGSLCLRCKNDRQSMPWPNMVSVCFRFYAVNNEKSSYIIRLTLYFTWFSSDAIISLAKNLGVHSGDAKQIGFYCYPPDSSADSKLLERVQAKATALVHGLKGLNSEVRKKKARPYDIGGKTGTGRHDWSL